MGKTIEGSALKRLRKLYAYDAALIRQQGHALGDEQSELESLALYHLDKQLVAATQEFFLNVGGSKDMSPGAVAVLMGLAGVLLAQIANEKDKKAATKAARFGKQYLEIRYAELLGDKK